MIRVGQVLRLAAPGEPAVAASRRTRAPGVTTAPLRAPPPVVESSARVGAPRRRRRRPRRRQRLGACRSARRGASDGLKTSPKAIKEPYSDQAVRELTLAASAVPAPPDTLAMAAPAACGRPAEPKPEPSRAARRRRRRLRRPRRRRAGDADKLDWAWPAKGKVIAGFSDTRTSRASTSRAPRARRFIASAPGRVVYAGTGLRGYGKLIIIKHNATYLSAYAHNREILVKEGQQVTRGQKIAEMGNTDAEQVKLHFEIRRQGKPMDPIEVPAARAESILTSAAQQCRRRRQHVDRALERRDQREPLALAAAGVAVAQRRERVADRAKRDRELRPARRRALGEGERTFVRQARQSGAREPAARRRSTASARAPGACAAPRTTRTRRRPTPAARPRRRRAICHGANWSSFHSRHSARCRSRLNCTTLRRHSWLIASNASCASLSQPPSCAREQRHRLAGGHRIRTVRARCATARRRPSDRTAAIGRR